MLWEVLHTRKSVLAIHNGRLSSEGIELKIVIDNNATIASTVSKVTFSDMRLVQVLSSDQSRHVDSMSEDLHITVYVYGYIDQDWKPRMR
jgi:hypothetical protein